MRYDSVIESLANKRECVFFNPNIAAADEALSELSITTADTADAEGRLLRFAPAIEKAFPDTVQAHGIIESPLVRVNNLGRQFGSIELLLKCDSDLPVAGSVKARGGVYEVLLHAEKLATDAGLLHADDDYSILVTDELRRFFKKYSIHVGSTGNLGLSIGITSAALGFNPTVHMSADAREWKKQKLRSCGVTVKEYPGEYSQAVSEGRTLSKKDPYSYFVDDESSLPLLLGYSTAAGRLAAQLSDMGVTVDRDHPLFVCIPCGVGGAPAGIAFGLKCIYKDDVHIFYAEPTGSPCMLLSLATELGAGICVQDIGLSGRTHADGLAVGRSSALAYEVSKKLVSGVITIDDAKLYENLRLLYSTEGIFAEPSACASFVCAESVNKGLLDDYMKKHCKTDAVPTFIAWLTGGSMVPQEIKQEYLATVL